MYTDKDSNLISDLRTKYGEESVRLFRKWEIIVKKWWITGTIGDLPSNVSRPV